MNRRTSPSTSRDLLLLGLLVAVLAGFVILAGVLMLGAALTSLLLHGEWAVPGFTTWLPGGLAVLAHPGQPGDGLGRPWADALRGQAGWYWAATALVLVTTAAGLALVGVHGWRRFGPVQAGHACREDIHDELSLAAVRATAEWTRPGLPAATVRRVPPTEVGTPLHLSPWRTPMWTSFENPTGTLAPTQSGKSRRDLTHKAIGAPGALLCSTTKPDLLEFSGLLRAQRHGAGTVRVFDATGAVPWPARVRWLPYDGCDDPRVAFRRASAWVEASATDLNEVSGNDKVFRNRAKIVLQSYFIAAAVHSRDVADVIRWATSKPADQEPVKLLQQAGFPEYARNLRQEIGLVAETSDAVWLSVRRAIEPLMDPQLRWLCSPGPGESFDAAEFIAAGGSLYLIAGQEQAAQAAPILTALVDHWLSTAREMALRTPHRRLDPPAVAILDELTSATPVPSLPMTMADTAGRGVPIHWGDQSVAALEETYGLQGARRLLDNTTTLSVWGGIKDKATLQWVSLLTDHHERLRHQEQSDGILGKGRTSTGLETVPTYRPGAVRKIRRGRVLVIHRHLDPILARTVDVKKRADWPAIRDHVAAVRAGRIPISPAGHLLATPIDGCVERELPERR